MHFFRFRYRSTWNLGEYDQKASENRVIFQLPWEPLVFSPKFGILVVLFDTSAGRIELGGKLEYRDIINFKSREKNLLTYIFYNYYVIFSLSYNWCNHYDIIFLLYIQCFFPTQQSWNWHKWLSTFGDAVSLTPEGWAPLWDLPWELKVCCQLFAVK